MLPSTEIRLRPNVIATIGFKVNTDHPHMCLTQSHVNSKVAKHLKRPSLLSIVEFPDDFFDFWCCTEQIHLWIWKQIWTTMPRPIVCFEWRIYPTSIVFVASNERKYLISYGLILNSLQRRGRVYSILDPQNVLRNEQNPQKYALHYNKGQRNIFHSRKSLHDSRFPTSSTAVGCPVLLEASVTALIDATEVKIVWRRTYVQPFQKWDFRNGKWR